MGARHSPSFTPLLPCLSLLQQSLNAAGLTMQENSQSVHDNDRQMAMSNEHSVQAHSAHEFGPGH